MKVNRIMKNWLHWQVLTSKLRFHFGFNEIGNCWNFKFTKTTYNTCTFYRFYRFFISISKESEAGDGA